MFRFHNPYEYDPFAGGYRAPHQPQPQQYRRGGSPYEDLFGSGVHPANYRYAQQPQELRRQQLLEQRRRQEEELLRLEHEKRLRAQKEREAQEAKRRELLARATKAAVVIQRAVRVYLAKVRAERARVQAERADRASRQIVRVVRFVAAVKEARGIADSLRKLRTIDGAIKTEFEAFKKRPCGYRNTLRFADTIEKRIISLDSVPRRRSTFVQERRRAIITEAQRALHYADFVQKMLVSKAVIVQRATRRFLAAKNQAKLERAANVVLRVLRSVPKIRQARKVAAQLKDIRAQTKILDDLRTQYMQALRDARVATTGTLASATTCSASTDTLAALASTLQQRVDRELAGLELKTEVEEPKAPEAPEVPAAEVAVEEATKAAADGQEELVQDEQQEQVAEERQQQKSKKKRSKKNKGKSH